MEIVRYLRYMKRDLRMLEGMKSLLSYAENKEARLKKKLRIKKKRTHCGVNKEIKGCKIFYKHFKVKSKKLYSPLHSSACNFRSCTKFTLVAERLLKSFTITSSIAYIRYLFAYLTGPIDRARARVCACVRACVCVFYKGRIYCWEKLKQKTRENL
jgi:hypothetical protein